jgi:hypothetical protein
MRRKQRALLLFPASSEGVAHRFVWEFQKVNGNQPRAKLLQGKSGPLVAGTGPFGIAESACCELEVSVYAKVITTPCAFES